MNKYTPGPWHINTAGSGDGKGNIVIDEIYVYAPESGADDVAVAADIADPLTGKPSEANARLIAAAPELLEALKDVMYWDNGKPEWEDARAAIAKAEGTA